MKVSYLELSPKLEFILTTNHRRHVVQLVRVFINHFLRVQNDGVHLVDHLSLRLLVDR